MESQGRSPAGTQKIFLSLHLSLHLLHSSLSLVSSGSTRREHRKGPLWVEKPLGTDPEVRVPVLLPASQRGTWLVGEHGLLPTTRPRTPAPPVTSCTPGGHLGSCRVTEEGVMEFLGQASPHQQPQDYLQHFKFIQQSL